MNAVAVSLQKPPKYRTMDETIKKALWSQFGAAIDMMERAIQACPDEVWGDMTKKPGWVATDVVGFWYLASHCLFFLDLYLSGTLEGFAPPPPFGMEEMDPAGLLPELPYSKEQLQMYLNHCRNKARTTIATLTQERANERCSFSWGELSFLELQLDSMRHVQHHTAQMHLLLRLKTHSAPRWVSKTKVPLAE